MLAYLIQKSKRIAKGLKSNLKTVRLIEDSLIQEI